MKLNLIFYLGTFTLFLGLTFGQMKPRSIALTETFKDAQKQVYINELAVRSATFGKPSWIELWNNRDERVNLKGYAFQSMTSTEKIKQDLWIKPSGFALILVYPGIAGRSTVDMKADLVIENSSLFKAMFELSDIESKVPLKYRKALKKRFPNPKEYRRYFFRDPQRGLLLANELALISSSDKVISYSIWNTDAFRFMKPHPSRVKKSIREKVLGPQFGHGGDPDNVRILLTENDSYRYILPRLSAEDTPGADLLLPAPPPVMELASDKWGLRAKGGQIGPFDTLSYLRFNFRCRLAYDSEMKQSVFKRNELPLVSKQLVLPRLTVVDRIYLNGRKLYVQAGYVNRSLGEVWGTPVELKLPHFRGCRVLNNLISFEKEDIVALKKQVAACMLPIAEPGEYSKINYPEKPADNKTIIRNLRKIREFEGHLAKMDVVGYSLSFSNDYNQVEVNVHSGLARKLNDLKWFAPIALTGILDLRGSQVEDLSPLSGKDGITLHLPPTADLTTLKDVKLHGLNLHGTPIPNGLQLIKQGVTVRKVLFDKTGTDTPNLIEGQGKLIEFGVIGDIKDLRALKELKLESFSLKSVTKGDYSELDDLSVLKGMPLKRFSLESGRKFDLLFLADMSLTHLSLWGSWHGSWQEVIDNFVKRQTLTHLGLTSCNNLTSLRGFEGWKLKFLNLRNCTNLRSELDELAGMPLQELDLTSCDKLRIEDLNMLKGAPLEKLFLEGCHVTDISALLNLKDLNEITLPESCNNVEVLKKHPSVKRINGKLSNDFWKDYKEKRRGGVK